MRGPMRTLARAGLLAVGLAVAGAGCAPEPAPPELVKLVEVAPRAVRAGDRVEVLGVGFGAAEMREASVELVGELSRAGEGARTRERIAVPIAQVGHERVTFGVQEALLARICGRGDEARHTTFHGDVLVTFHPTGEGRSAVRGTLHDVTLDFVPPEARRAVADARREAARGALEHLGLRLGEEAPSAAPGLVIEEVRAGGRADAAGLRAGELLVEVDGVTILAVDDASPRGGSSTASFKTRPKEAPDARADRVSEVSIVGVTPTSPGELGAATALLAPLAALALAFFGPLGRAWGAFELRYRTRPGARADRDVRADRLAERVIGVLRQVLAWPAHAVRALSREMAPDRRGGDGHAWAARLVFAGVSATLCALPFGQRLVAHDLDLGVLVLPAFSLLVLCAALTGLLSARRAWQAPFMGLLSALRAAIWQIPFLAAVTHAVLAGGSLRVGDLADVQAGSGGAGFLSRGSWPWHALALSGPIPLLLLLCALAALAVEQRFEALGAGSPAARAARLAESRVARASERVHQVVAFFADWAHVFLVCGLLAALYLGGFGLPGVATSTPLAAALGAAFYLVKSWLLVLVVATVRAALRLSMTSVERLFLARLLPISLALLVVGALLHEQPIPPQLATMVRAATCSIALAFLGLAILRLHVVSSERLRAAQTNPFR